MCKLQIVRSQDYRQCQRSRRALPKIAQIAQVPDEYVTLIKNGQNSSSITSALKRASAEDQVIRNQGIRIAEFLQNEDQGVLVLTP